MAKSSTSWKAGESGNPSGRPKLVTEVRDMAREHTPAAINRLVELIDSETGTTAVAACKELLDRAWGRAPQSIDIDQTVRPGKPASEDAPDTKGLMALLRQGNRGRVDYPASPKQPGSNKPNGTGEPCKAGVKPKKARAPSTDATDSSQP